MVACFWGFGLGNEFISEKVKLNNILDLEMSSVEECANWKYWESEVDVCPLFK